MDSRNAIANTNRDYEVTQNDQRCCAELVERGFATRNRHGLVSVRWARVEPIVRSGEYVAVSEDGRRALVKVWLTSDGGNVIGGWRAE